MSPKCELGNRLFFSKNSYTKLCYKPSLYHWQLALLSDHWDVVSRTGLLFLSIHKAYSPLCSTTFFHGLREPVGNLSRRRFVFLMYYSTNADPMQIFLKSISIFFLVIWMKLTHRYPFSTAICL